MILSLCSEENYLAINFPIHGKHDGESCNFVYHCIRKLQLVFRINFSVVATVTPKVIIYEAETSPEHTFSY